MKIAFYKKKRKVKSMQTLLFRTFDELTRLLTRGEYSHCEIAIPRDDGLYDCYSASVRDGGVRKKVMKLHDKDWDFVDIACEEQTVINYYRKTKDCGYDFFGAIGVVLPFSQSNNRQFCSEWCFNAVFDSDQGWRFSPNQLAVLQY